MKILQINANYGFGSTGLIVEDIGEEITRSKNQAYFAYQKTNRSVKNGYVVGNFLDWKMHAIFSRIFGGQGYYSRFMTYKFIHKLKKIQPDVIHLHNLHSNFINIAVLFNYLSREDIATVITMHDCWYYTGKCFHYVDCNCERFKEKCGNCPKKKAPPKSLIFDWTKKSLEHKRSAIESIPRLRIVGCSNWISSEAKKGILRNTVIETIYNGIDTSIFRPRNNTIRSDYNIGNSFIVMGMANKWLLNENIDMLDKVALLPNVKLMIVGCTNEQKKIVNRINKNIISVGFVNDRVKLAEYYSAADVFVNLTHADTLPTVNMESICCNTPVITYDSCGSPELIDDETGKIVKENDKKGVLEAILNIMDTKFENCSSVGVKRFDNRRCYKRYIEIYNELIQQKKC